jgi:hypothetical protein
MAKLGQSLKFEEFQSAAMHKRVYITIKKENYFHDMPLIMTFGGKK